MTSPFAALRRRFPTLAQVFASGANRVGDLLEFAAAGIAPGVAVHDLNRPALQTLQRLAASGVPVFIGSGAFSEVWFRPNGPFVQAPITDSEWQDRLATMLDVARIGSPSVSVMAPDIVGFQAETLARLERSPPPRGSCPRGDLRPRAHPPSVAKWVPSPSI